MSKVWNIYSKNTPITGTPKLVAEKLEYHDIWMGEEYVMVTLTSPMPLSLEIGDYLIYRGRKYSIYNIPSALKQARRLSHGEAFKYENVKFSAYTTELSEIRFLDIVLGDNNLHYTSLPTFGVYCETVDDLVDRLQANTDREKATYSDWYFITPSKQRTLQRVIKWDPTAGEQGQGAWVPDVERQAVAEQIWNKYFQNVDPEITNEKKNVNISVDKASVWDGLTYVKQHFGLNFITNCESIGRVAVIGASAKHTENCFQYGKGNGLSQIERVADSDQVVVTKLFAYGSDKNLPYHHYSDLTTRPYLKVTGDYHTSSTEHGISVLLENISTVSAFTNKVNTGTGTTYCTFTCMIGNIVCDGNAELVGISGSSTYSVRLLLFAQGSTAGNPNSKFTTQEVIDSIKAILDNAIASGIQEMVVFMSDTDITKFPDNRRYMLVYGMPNNMAVNCLMLPGFPLYALNDVVKCEYIEVEDEHYVNETRFYVRNIPDNNNNWPSIPSFIIPGNHVFTFSTDRLRPWIKSPNSTELGIKEGDVHFDEENDDNGLQDVHPSIEGMTEDDVFHNGSNVRLDEIDSADIITDNGRFDETATKPDFHVVIRDLGFDLKKAFTDAGSSMKLSMKDGYCGGRDFNVKTMVQLSDGKWRLTLERLPDESLEIYFPYSDAASHYETPVANEPYQIRTGDHFVITDILIQDTNYVHAASVELFRKACLWLASNDYTRFTYMPKIDEIFMARDNDTAYSSEYQTIKAGKMMDFADTDFLIDASIYIDQLTIKEGGNQDIPIFDVTLREDKQVGTIQRMQNQINSLQSLAGDSGGAALRYLKSIWDFDSNGNLFTKYNVYSLLGISALGVGGSSGGGGGASTLEDLLDVSVSNPQNREVLKYDSTLQKWVNAPDQGITSVDWSIINNKPTTIIGYGILDAYISGDSVVLGGSTLSTYNAVTSRTANTVLAAPNGSNGAATFRALVAADIPSLTVSKISDIGTYYVAKSGGTMTGILTMSNDIIINGNKSIAFDVDNTISADTYDNESRLYVTGYDGVHIGVSNENQVAHAYLDISDSGITTNKSIKATGLYVGNKAVLTDHQTIYGLTIYGDSTAVLTYTPNTNASSIYIKASGDIVLSNDITEKSITLYYSHPTNGANTTITAANGKVLSAITVNNLGHVTSVSSKTLASDDIPTLAISKISGLQAALDSKLDIAAFERLFNAIASDGTTKINHPYSSAVASIKAMFGLWTESYISALGLNNSGSGGGGGSLSELSDVSINGLASGQLLRYNSSSTHWENFTPDYATQSWVLGRGYISPTLTNLANGDMLVYDSGVNWVNVPMSTILSGYATQSWVGLNYLPLTGGTISGDLTVSGNVVATANVVNIHKLYLVSGWQIQMVDRNDDNSTKIGFNSNNVLYLNKGMKFGGSVEATSFVKTGGTSSQFLKADGSVDSNTYLTSLPSHNHDDRYYIDQYGTIHLGNGSITPVTSLTGYATQTWVQNQGYITSSALSGYLPLTGGTMTGVLIMSDDISVNENHMVYFDTDNSIGADTYSSSSRLYVTAYDGIYLNISNENQVTHAYLDITDSGIVTNKSITATGLYVNSYAVRTTNDTYINNGTIYIGSSSVTPITSLSGYIHPLITSLENNDILIYNSTSANWVNVSKSSFLSGYISATLTSIGNGDILVYDSGNGWVNTSKATFLSGYATQSWVQSQGYLTSLPSHNHDDRYYIDQYGTIHLGSSSLTPVTSLTGYATQSWVQNQGYLTSLSLGNLSNVSLSGTTDGQVLTYQSSNGTWVNKSITFPVTSVAGYTGAVTAANISTAIGLSNYATQTWVGQNYLSLTNGGTITGTLNMANGTPISFDIDNNINAGTYGNSTRLYVTAYDGVQIKVANEQAITHPYIDISDSGIVSNSSITATSFVKSGGTSSQFLKADGSVDSNTYLTSASLSGYIHPTLTNLANGDLLVYDSVGAWVNVPQSTILSGYATQSWVTSQNYVKTVSLYSEGTLKFLFANNSTSIVDLTHQHRFEELIDVPTTLDDFGITGGTVTGSINLATSGGNVGIGTTSPSSIYKLDVNGGIRATQLRLGDEFIASHISYGFIDSFMVYLYDEDGGFSPSDYPYIHSNGLYNADGYTSVLTSYPTLFVDSPSVYFCDPYQNSFSGHTVYAGKIVVGTDASTTHKLYVSGTVNATGTIYQNGTAVSLNGHTHSYLPLSGGTITGTLNMANDTPISFDIDNNINAGTYGNSTRLYVTAYDGVHIKVANEQAITHPYIDISDSGIVSNSSITATSFVKSGGTSSQFLKADGSVDTNTYLTSASLNGYLHPTLTNLANGNVLVYDSTGAWVNTTQSNLSVGYASSAGSVAWSNVSGRPTNVSSFTNDSGYITSSALSGYLPLTGGTMTGILTMTDDISISSNKLITFDVDNSISADTYGNATRLYITAYYGIHLNVSNENQVTHTYLDISDSGVNINGNAVIHAGNIGSQSVNYATSAGSANILSHSVSINSSHSLSNGDVLVYDSAGSWLNVPQSTILSGYATQSWVTNQNYLKTVSLYSEGTLKFLFANNSTSIVDLTHQHRFEELIDVPTTLDDFGITGGTVTGGVNLATTSGNVGIGTTSPSSKLHVVGNGYFSGNLTADGQLVVEDKSTFKDYVNLYDLHFLNSNDNDIFNITETNGDMAFIFSSVDAYFSGATLYDFGADVYAPSFQNNSDIRLKNVLEYGIEPTCEAVANAPAIKYTWNALSKNRNTNIHLGSVAQYWQTVLPETVSRGKDGYLAMQYDVIALLASIATAKRVMEHERRIEQLERENALLRMEINDLKDAA